MKFCSEAIKQLAHLGAEGFFRPSGEFTPMVLGLFPQDFDHIEFRAIGRQKDKGGFVIDKPTLSDFVINAVMDSGIVEHDESWFGSSDIGEKVVIKATKVSRLTVPRLADARVAGWRNPVRP